LEPGAQLPVLAVDLIGGDPGCRDLGVQGALEEGTGQLRLGGKADLGRNTGGLASARQRWLGGTLLIELGLAVTAGVVAIGLPVEDAEPRRFVVIALLAAALGLHNATVRRLAVPDITTTVLTMTLTGLAADFGLAGHSPRAGRRLTAVGLMAAGALIGALLLRVDVGLPVLAAAVVIGLAAEALRFGRAQDPA
jgi:uncharacterized membrane protein YoaK (UPF0700 family)